MRSNNNNGIISYRYFYISIDTRRLAPPSTSRPSRQAVFTGTVEDEYVDLFLHKVNGLYGINGYIESFPSPYI